MNLKKYFGLITMLFMLTGCMATPEMKVENDIAKLEKNKAILIEQTYALEENIRILKESNNYERYVVTIEIRQSHSFDFTKMMKDSLNVISINIPVDKAFYDSVDVGTVLDNSFRMGSMLMDNSMGNWKISIIEKTITNE